MTKKEAFMIIWFDSKPKTERDSKLPRSTFIKKHKKILITALIVGVTTTITTTVVTVTTTTVTKATWIWTLTATTKLKKNQ